MVRTSKQSSIEAPPQKHGERRDHASASYLVAKPYVPGLRGYFVVAPRPRPGQSVTTQELLEEAVRQACRLSMELNGVPEGFTLLYNAAETRRRPWPHVHILISQSVLGKRVALALYCMKHLLRCCVPRALRPSTEEQGPQDDERQLLTRELLALLARTTYLVSISDGFDWATWDGPAQAVAELDALAVLVSQGELPKTLPVLFLPAGDLQEVSMGSGWANEYLELAVRFDELWAALTTSW